MLTARRARANLERMANIRGLEFDTWMPDAVQNAASGEWGCYLRLSRGLCREFYWITESSNTEKFLNALLKNWQELLIATAKRKGEYPDAFTS